MRMPLIVLILALSEIASAQDSLFCHIKLSLKSKTARYINVSRTGLSLNSADTKNLAIFPSTTYQKVVIPREGLYSIADGYAGHTIFITSGDSIKMDLVEKPNGMDDGSFQLHRFMVCTKYSGNYTFYDEFRRKYQMSKRELNENSVHFKLRCDSILLVGNALLQNYHKRGIISPRFKLLAEAEIRAQYVGWMCTILSDADRNNFTTSYCDALEKFQFTNNTYAVEGYKYTQAAYLMSMYINNRYSSGYSDSVCRRDFKSIVNTYSGELKDKLMAWYIMDNAEHNTTCFDSVYRAFQSLCQSSYIKRGCMRKVEEIRADMKKTDNLSLGDILNKSFVVDVDGRRRSINSILADSIPTVIDCWATWCGPCREQMPYIHAIERQYKGKVRLVYISLDENGQKWVEFLRSKKQFTGNTFRMVDSDNAPFLPAMRLKNIPRFILIRKGDADVLNAWLPMPSDTKAFEQALKAYVN